MHFATDVSAIVKAEIAQRNFVQTLTKTFAQLSIGLAIFDRERQLVLFNPAVIDLTSLPAEFLSSRPNLMGFFDRLREQRIMPEPKSYTSWRAKLAELVAAAKDGSYQEIWTLPSGLTYRISGRPHPDGAIAFLFEDISAEISLTRRFRGQIEQSQAVIDSFAEAICVFSPTGTLTFCNEAYRNLWKTDPDNSFAEFSIIDATRQWQAKCKASPVWGEIRDFAGELGERVEWFDDVYLESGEPLECRCVPLPGGTTMIGFRTKARQIAMSAHSN